jgi:CrcB protein
MIPYLLVALGGAVGSVGRYAFGLAAGRLWGDAFPIGTILINILGSFVIAFYGALTLPDGPLPASGEMRLLVMVGVCGGFTTFSSFSLQTLLLMRGGLWGAAAANVLISVAACLGAAMAGQAAAMRLGAA